MSNNLGDLWFVVQEFKMGRVSNSTSHPKCVWGWGRKEGPDICTTGVTVAKHPHGMKCAHCWLGYNLKGAHS